MPPSFHLRPGQPKRYYVGIDVTKTLDTVAVGHLWYQKFGWENLVWKLKRDGADSQRRVDSAHKLLPIRRLQRSFKGQQYADTCILPAGDDGHGLDKLWPGKTGTDNLTEINDNCVFMQTFVTCPTVDAAAASLNDKGVGLIADVLYLSSHGSHSANMFGDVYSDSVFDVSLAAQNKRFFHGVGWLLLSNCYTLSPPAHGDWLKLLNPTVATPANWRRLRGMVGFHEGTCPLAEGSVNVFSNFIDRLANGNTFVVAWREAMRAHGYKDRWGVVCNSKAVDDKIAVWNDDKLDPIGPGDNSYLLFTEGNLGGAPLVPAVDDPFEAFWAKNGVRITRENMNEGNNPLRVGDKVTITVQNTGATPNIPANTDISITLFFVRPDYPFKVVDVVKQFVVLGQTAATAPTISQTNIASKGSDTWSMKTTAATPSVVLSLKCADLSDVTHAGLPFNFRVKLGTQTHDFIRNGNIIVVK
ncbi:unnamed protein product [Gemmata massiliana]|uniref:Uncharacterized protein n=1 Tax=Gemmata massiliana TaxID=1210884 RepID=A0A6P2CVE1_9BACT|nr:hypothetical protein [Gemmata massiliana]VTR92929.1 unnamed protein product [Gemmata massiliana]